MEIETSTPHFFPHQLLNVDVEPTAEIEPHPSKLQSPLSVLTPVESTAATKLQKVYRSYRTRRRLADSAVIVEELLYDSSRLDIGDGRNVDLKECPRSLLRQQCIKYMGPQERQNYEYVALEGKIVHKQSGDLLDTGNGSGGAKWIFVMSTSKNLYAGQKKKGQFHHSSFLAGGATLAAGRFIAENGVLKCIWAYSGHYRPSQENLNNFLTFLREHGVDLSEVQILSSSNEDYYDDPKKEQAENKTKSMTFPEPPQLLGVLTKLKESRVPEPSEPSDGEVVNEVKATYKRTLSGGLQSPRADVPQKSILERIKLKKEACSYQLGKQLSLKWCTGAGPRIGCVADYPVELRMQALELVNLSPRSPPTPNSCRLLASCLSPKDATADGIK